jgi:hypothetical protein
MRLRARSRLAHATPTSLRMQTANLDPPHIFDSSLLSLFPPPCVSDQVEQRLHLVQQGKWLDPRPEYERSPSPEPVYDSGGARINTREWRQKEELTKKRGVSGRLRGGGLVSRGAEVWEARRRGRVAFKDAGQVQARQKR